MNAAGGASLNAADRLAIINLFEAYARNCDAGKPGEFLSVFTETTGPQGPVVVMLSGGQRRT